ncbi:MAG: L-threonylcarbamoyladenylate synthase [Alphaproteobacteria bacterium]
MPEPRILPISPEAIAEGARLLREGRLVAFPTETVYGLGADATNERAVASVFAAKGRPHFNPLIVHVPDLTAARRLVDVDARAEAVAARFWPGPLTLVLTRRPGSGLSLLASAGLPTVAIRVPAHDTARDLLRMAAIPVVGPSANASGKLSPTTAAHVAASLGSRVDLILDAGPCPVGVESTVLDLSGETPVLLRPGGLAAEQLEAALGAPLALAGSDDSAPRSPGMLTSHYAPAAPVRLGATSARPGEVLLGFGPDAPATELNLSPAGDLTEAAANLFAFLHALDRPDIAGIAVMPIPERGLGRAINDRLRRAAAERPLAPATDTAHI